MLNSILKFILNFDVLGFRIRKFYYECQYTDRLNNVLPKRSRYVFFKRNKISRQNSQTPTKDYTLTKRKFGIKYKRPLIRFLVSFMKKTILKERKI